MVSTGGTRRAPDTGLSDALAAIRSLPHGGLDASTSQLDVPLSVRSAVAPAINALRWGALGYGLVFAAPDAFRGSWAAVAATGVCLFITTFRTMMPVQLADHDWRRALAPLLDVAVMGLVVGNDGGVESSYFFCVLAAIMVVAFGWGAVRGLIATVLAIAAMVAGAATGTTGVGEQWNDQRDLAALMVVVIAVAGAAFVRSRLIDAEQRRSNLTIEVNRLNDTNDLLILLNQAARTLPNSLTLREALARTRQQLIDDFEVRTILLLTWDDVAEDWIPKLADGCTAHTSYTNDDLPPALRAALYAEGPVVVDGAAGNVPAVGEARGSGVYLRLVARDRTIGLLGLEHPASGHFDDRAMVLLSGLADVLGLSIDNARWFGRLRSLGAEEERIRIARDLHDRLGQWLTYIAFEIERITAAEDQPNPELQRLETDVRAAIDELRETLRSLRTGVDQQRPLAVLGTEIVERFSERASVPATFVVVHPDERLPIPIENELLRIMQEALTNIDRHARAHRVEVVWAVHAGNFELTIRDDGSGFQPGSGVRDSAYGLVGMRERADVIGARLAIDSAPGHGTTIRVTAGLPEGAVPTGPTRSIGQTVAGTGDDGPA